MDRAYRKKDRVYVYKSYNTEPPLAVFDQMPYTHAGFDNYEYKGVMYPGFVAGSSTYILLDQPLFK